jgi:hypothetical protein
MDLCFVSYARNNNHDGRLTRFVEALKKQLLQHLPNNTARDRIAFFDVQAIDTGEQWMQRLAEAARTCKVCVCFYSKPYFTSEYCGREVSVFMQRLRAWEKLAGAAGDKSHGLIPVLWIPEQVPADLQPFQVGTAAYPAKYHEEGLLALALRKNRRDAYNTVLDLLARRIAKAAMVDPPLPAGDEIASFDAVGSLFHAQSKPVRYGLAYAVLASPERRKRPFVDTATTLDALVKTACQHGAETVPARELTVNAQLPAALAASAAASEMVLIVASEEALLSANNAALVKGLDTAVDATTATVIVLPSAVPPRHPQVATEMAAGRLPDFARRARVDACLAAADATELTTAVRERVSTMRQALLLAQPAVRATDPALEAAAAAAGIALDTRPVLTGPGR